MVLGIWENVVLLHLVINQLFRFLHCLFLTFLIDHRYNERVSEPWQRGPTGASVPAASSVVGSSKTNYVSNGSGTNMLGNGVGLTSSGNSWSGNGNAQPDRWGSSSTMMAPGGRSMATTGAFNSNWTGSAPPLSSGVYNPAAGTIASLNNATLAPSGSVSYSNDRYSRH